MTAERGDFRGNPTLTLKRTPEDEFGFTFGLQKAALILDNLPAIRKFVRDYKPRSP